MRVLKLLFVVVVLILLSRVGILWGSHNLNVSSEANDLYGTLMLADGKPLYPVRTQVPYNVYLYLPVHAYLGAGLVWLSGVRELHRQVFLVRGLSLLALAVAFAFLWRTVLAPLKVDWKSSAAVLILASPKLADYASAARNDTLALCFEMMALSFFVNWLGRRRGVDFFLFLAVSFLSLWTRQSGVVFVSAMFYLLWHREYRRTLVTTGGFFVVSVGAFFLLWRQTHGAIIDHVFLSNIRAWRSINSQLFDPSLVGFFLSYVAFSLCVVAGVKPALQRRNDPVVRMLALVFFSSFCFAVAVFMRAGGDVNYFFETILAGVYFAVLGWQRLSDSASRLVRTGLAVGLAFQLVAISGLYLAKDRSAMHDGSRPFDRISERLRTEIPRYGYVIGPYSEMMSVYLRGWLFQGPDVTSGSWVSRNSHKSMRSLVGSLHHAMGDGTVNVIVDTTPGCGAVWETLGGARSEWFKEKEVWDSGVCLFRSKLSPHLSPPFG